jgi:hypothetical protein
MSVIVNVVVGFTLGFFSYLVTDRHTDAPTQLSQLDYQIVEPKQLADGTWSIIEEKGVPMLGADKDGLFAMEAAPDASRNTAVAMQQSV